MENFKPIRIWIGFLLTRGGNFVQEIKLSPENKRVVLERIKTFFLKERDEEISDFKAEIYLDFILAQPGVYIYNQAIADAHALMIEKSDELFALEKQEKTIHTAK